MEKRLYNRAMSMENSGIRINKYLSEYGICSRREADRLIESGQVSIDGNRARMGDRVMPGQKVSVKGKPIREKDKEVLLLFHKPRGVVCTSQKRDKNNIIDYIGYPVRIYPIGRLDQDSEGLILLTNCGPVANMLTHPSYSHEKEYQVKVDKPITDAFLKKMGSGVPILGTVTAPCKVRKLGEKEFSIILTQGMNRQIRRMCEYLGYRVLRLRRVRILDFYLDGLKEGQYREATKKEWGMLKRRLQQNQKNKKKEEFAQKDAQTGGNSHGRRASKNERTGTKAKGGK